MRAAPERGLSDMTSPGTHSADRPGAVQSSSDNDLFGAAAIADPYAYFGKLRETDPVHWNSRHELWLITRYDDVVRVTGQPEVFSNSVFQRDPRPPYPAVDPADTGLYEFTRHFLSRWFVQFDPPEHLQMRKALAGCFSPRAVERWRAGIRSTVSDLLDRGEDNGGMDLVSEFATPMPLLVITRMLGLPDADHRYIQEELGPALLHMSRGEAARLQTLAEGIRKLQDYISVTIAQRTAASADDLLSALLEGEKAGTFNREQVIANAILLLVAGYDTTSSLISNGVLAFIRHPDQWQLLRQAPAPMLKAAIEECLRFDSPQKTVQRLATQDVPMRDGKRIRKLDRLRLVISSANRDPTKFADPDRFDISRAAAGHVSFGYGLHHCIGAAMARLQTQEALHALAQRYAALHLADERLEYQPSISFRSLKSMRLTWSRA